MSYDSHSCKYRKGFNKIAQILMGYEEEPKDVEKVVEHMREKIYQLRKKKSQLNYHKNREVNV